VAGVEQLEIRRTGYLDRTARVLIDAAMADLAVRYGSADETPVDPAEFAPPDGDFVVAFLDGVPLGCGGWRSHGRDGSAAEIKRMFTRAEARRRGVGRAVLHAVEESARAAGRVRVALETGKLQPAVGPRNPGGASAPDDLAGLQAGGADLHALEVGTAGPGAHGLDVGVPTTVGPPVRERNVVAEARPLATDVAHASHGNLLGLIVVPSRDPPPGNLTRLADAPGAGPIDRSPARIRANVAPRQ
jgi:GNAT superfamily N-acetyltransferase